MKSILFGKTDLYYHDRGMGPVVVLIHGFGEDSQIWNSTVDLLQKEYRLIVPDLPGSGRSLQCEEGASMELMAEAVHAIFHKESISSAIMIGHSMGGYISLAFAEKYGSKLLGLGLFHSTAFPDSQEKIEARRKSIEFIEQQGAAKFIRQSTPNLFSKDFKENHPSIVKDFVEKYTNFSSSALVSYYKGMIARPDRSSVLTQFSKPVLFILGRQDNAIPLESNLSQCHLPGIAHVKILEHSGHMGMMEEPGVSLPFLSAFLKETFKSGVITRE